MPKSAIVYENSFGLSQNPFNLTSDPRFLYLTRQTSETLHQLTHGILCRKGLILLLGGAGTGKTTLLYAALRRLEASSPASRKMATAIIVNPTLTREELLEAVLDDFEVPCVAASKPQRLETLRAMLLDVREKGGRAVLVVDEAHLLTTKLLDELQLLLRQTADENLLQMVLSGQPEIEEKLEQIELRDLLQSVTVRCKTEPLTLKDTDDYIRHRLRIAGAKSELIFQREAVEAVYIHSRGIPRVINLLCDHALVSAHFGRIQRVCPPLIVEAAAKLRFHDIEPLAQRLNIPHSSHTATFDLPSSQPTLNRDEARTCTAAAQAVTRKRPPISGRLTPMVGSLDPVSGTRTRISIRMWSQSLDRWWSHNLTFARAWTGLFTKGFVDECRTRSRMWISFPAIECLLKARSHGKLVRCLREWLQAPWSRDRKLVCQIMHLREWLQTPWCHPVR